jgi:iron complex transport system substrate-binding protein
MKNYFALILLLLSLGACQSEINPETEKIEEIKRIVSLNGTITETLIALETTDSIVGVDVTSSYPSSVEKIQNLGHISTISVEGILSLNPTHVLVYQDELKPQIKDQLKQAKVEVVEFEREYSIEGSKKSIEQIAKWSNKVENGKKLIEDINLAVKNLSKNTEKPSVLFIYARGAGSLMVAGDDTQLAKMIELAGGKNAVSGFSDFKPLTAEAVVAANPDIILMFDSGAASLSGTSGILTVPGVKMTNAGKNKRIITMEGLLLSGFGPRIGTAISTLNQEFFKN